MTAKAAQALRFAALALLAVGWMLAAHLGSTGNGPPDLNVGLALLPILAALGALVFRLLSLPLAGLLGLALLAGILLLWPLLRDKIALLYLLQHVGINLMLASLFGRSLLGPGEALITQLARRVFVQGISPRKARYTRAVTVAWTIFFLANASVSLLLYLLAPATLWSTYANLGNPLLIAVMFLCEHLWRRRVLPPEERPRIADVVRAWRHHHAPPAA